MSDTISVAFQEIEPKAQSLAERTIKDFQMTEDIDKNVHLISDILVNELIQLSKNFKWLVNCIILEAEGAKLVSEVSSFWDRDLDGCLRVQIPKEKFIVNVVIFCLAL